MDLNPLQNQAFAIQPSEDFSKKSLAKQKDAAEDFEAMFIQSSLKEMRPKSEGGLFNDGLAVDVFYQFMDEAIAKEIAHSPLKGQMPRRAVITGGASQLPGIEDIAGRVLKMPVRKGQPNIAEILGETYSDGFLRIERQTKGRKGKGVSIISGLALPPEEFKKLAQTVKKKCGKGGAVKDGTVEIQGDDREQIKAVLESLGYKCKLAGG